MDATSTELDTTPFRIFPTGWVWWLPALLGAITIGITPWPPMLDWPLHIAQAAQLARWGDPTFLPEGVYCRSAFSSYHLFHYVVSQIYQMVGPHWVSRIALLFLYFFYHLSVGVLLRVYRADERAIAIASPVFFGYLYLMGFGSFLLGVPLFILTMAVAQIWQKKEHWAWGAALFACLVITFAIHLMLFYLTMTSLGVRWCAEWAWHKKWRWRIFAVLLLPGIAGIYRLLSLGSFFKVQLQFWSKLKQLNPDMNWVIQEPSLWKKLLNVPYFLIGNEYMTSRDMLMGLFLLTFVIALLLLRIVQRKAQGARPEWGIWGLALTPLLFYFGLKQYQTNVNFVNGRFLLPGFLMFLALIPPMTSNQRGTWLLRLGLMTSLTFLTINATYHLQWTQGLAGLHKITQRIPPNSRVLGVLSHFRHAPSIVQTYRGGEIRLSFSYYRHMPIVDCDPMRQIQTWPVSTQVKKFNPYTMKWDYLLVYLDKRGRQLRAKYPWLFRSDVPYRPLYRSGKWLLMKRISRKRLLMKTKSRKRLLMKTKSRKRLLMKTKQKSTPSRQQKGKTTKKVPNRAKKLTH